MRSVLESLMILEDNSSRKDTSILMRSRTRLMASTPSEYFQPAQSGHPCKTNINISSWLFTFSSVTKLAFTSLR